jgi:hypothetical protein
MTNWNEGSWTRMAKSSQAMLAQVLFGGTKTGAVVRLILTVVSIGSYWVIIVAATGYPGEVPLSLLQSFPQFTYVFLNVLATFFNPEVLVHLIPVLGALFFSLFFAALYLQDLYELDGYGTAFRYLLATVFGIGYPRMAIRHGDAELINPYNSLKAIGGPGYVRIHLGYAAVFEDPNGIPMVLGPSPGVLPDQSTQAETNNKPRATFFVEGYQRLKDVIDLRDQLGGVAEIHCWTRDGIEVIARDAQMLFRVYGGDQPRSLSNPYPYSEDAIRALVYGKAVTAAGAEKWEQVLSNLVKAEIQDFVSRLSLEEFLALRPFESPSMSNGADTPRSINTPAENFHIPRRDLTERFHTPVVVARLRTKGLELDWVGVGTWEVQDGSNVDTPDEISLSHTFLQAWRDYQRVRLYSSEDYRQRIRLQRRQERTLEVLEGLVRIWTRGELPEAHRCYETLSRLRQMFEEMDRSLASQPEYSQPEGLEQMLSHLTNLTAPRTLGSQTE